MGPLQQRVPRMEEKALGWVLSSEGGGQGPLVARVDLPAFTQ